MATFYKVKLALSGGSATVWVAVKASSEGEALVIADDRCLDTLFRICGDSVTAITEREYCNILANAETNRNL